MARNHDAKTEGIVGGFKTASTIPGLNERTPYKERKKFSTSCICERLSELNLRTTSLASEPQLWRSQSEA